MAMRPKDRERTRRAIRRNGWAMSAEERAALLARIDAAGVYCIPFRMTKGHRNAFRFRERPPVIMVLGYDDITGLGGRLEWSGRERPKGQGAADSAALGV